MSNINLRSRFKDAPWFPKEDTHVMIGGAGGIGSWVALLLARASYKIIIYDFDLLEEHNIGGQLYPKRLIGQHKVSALATVISDFADEGIFATTEKITEDSPTHIYCISAFDNMAARKAMFKNWYQMYGKDPNAIFIDGRLNAEQLQIFCVLGGHTESIQEKQQLYMTEHLFDDTEVEDAPCTMKQTSHTAAMIASHMVGFFTNHMTNVVEKEISREIPFYMEYFTPMNLVDVQTY